MSKEPVIEEPLRKFLERVRSRVVIIGSVARGVRWPKDLDLLWDMDSEPAKKLIKDNIQSLGLTFESPIIAAWTFRDYGWMVEIMGTHYGPTYHKVRRNAGKLTLWGIEFFVALPTDTPEVQKVRPDQWVSWPNPTERAP
jgi:hypothetical protein